MWFSLSIQRLQVKKYGHKVQNIESNQRYLRAFLHVIIASQMFTIQRLLITVDQYNKGLEGWRGSAS